MTRTRRSSLTALTVGLLGLGIAALSPIGSRLAPAAAPGTGPADAAPPPANGVPRSREGMDVVGRPAPDWGKLEWLNSPPITLEELRGRVVLLRFWTDTCSFCAATAPALRQIHHDFARRGLVVIGMYHPKPPGTRRPTAAVERIARDWHWSFPVALDTEWKTLNAFWLNARPRSATSATFVLDRKGIVRFVHPGPEYHPGGPPDHPQCRADYNDLRAALEALLSEKA